MLDSCLLIALEKHRESIFLKQSITAAVSRTNTLTPLFMYLCGLFLFFLFYFDTKCSLLDAFSFNSAV